MPELAPRASPEAPDRRADVVLLAAISIWALNFSAMKVGIAQIGPLPFPVLRYGVGAIVMALFVLRHEASLRFERRDLGLLLVASVLGVTLNQLCVVFALQLTTATNVSLLTATQPIFTAIIATIVGDEILGRRHWTAVALGMAGVVLIVEGGASQAAGASAATSGGLPVGELLALGVALTAAASWVAIRRLLARYSPYRILTAQMAIGTALLIPIAAPALVSEDYAAVTPLGWGTLAYSALLAGVVTNLLYYVGVRRVGASRAAVYQYLQSFLGVVFAVSLLHEPLRPLQIVGGIVVVAGVALSRRDQLRLRRRPASHPVDPAASAAPHET
ncbi:MAG TPA: DMT family transporter [Patescibacteria group bacterium]|nr:DMT family transporter [Patescibacteria group bacterium]